MTYTSVTPDLRQFDTSFTSESQSFYGVEQTLDTSNTEPMDLATFAAVSGLTERYIRENRDRLEQCLQRRISFKDRANKNRLMFEPEAIDLFKAWMSRKTDEAFAEQFAASKNVQTSEASDFQPEVTTAIVHTQEAPIDAEFVETLSAIVPAPVQDVTIISNRSKAELLVKAIVAADEQEELNEAQELEAIKHRHYEKGFNRRLVAVTSEKAGEQEADRFIAESQEIARLERQLAVAKARQGGDAQKAATKSRKR